MIEALKAFLAALIVSVTPASGDASSAWGTTHEARVMSVLVPLVAKWEGLSLTPYLDTIASPPVWTWCYGETEGQRKSRYTEQECKDMLESRLAHYHHALLPAFTAPTLADLLPPKRHAAFDSLSYNVGTYGVSRSTAVKRLNAGNVAGACEAITWWNRAGQRVVRGLVNRRADEKALCMDGVK